VEPTYVDGVDGVRVATWDLAGAAGGPGGRPALLVAHATGFHSRCYRALAASLGERFRVVGFDCPGHGHSTTPSLQADEEGRVPAMGWDRFGRDALAVVDALGLEHPVAFGHSSGGAVLLLAEQQRPGTFAAIYAYEPVALPPEAWSTMGERGFDPAAGARRRRPVFASRVAALEHLSSKPPLSSLRGDVLVDYVEGGFADRPDGAVSLRCLPEAEAATYAMAPRNDVWDRLGEVACPVVVGCGGLRADFGSDLAGALASRVQRGRVDEHAELGHLGPLEQPDEVAASVLAAATP
jgi:pimeloyl-ACP methyl ester carboxylesterase